MNYPKISASIYNALDDNQRDFLNIVQEHFPNVIKDGIVDFDALKEAMGNIEQPEGEEKYELTWAGKQESKREYLKEVLGKTLKFKLEDSLNADTTENLYIEGDNLEVMKLLKRNYRGKIKMIYIDPPYNTGSDFVYNDKFKYSNEELAKASNNTDEEGNPLQKNTKEDSKFHSKWLNMMYPRLKIARELLTEDGVIFISIDENENANLRSICDEIFGERNYFGDLIWEATTQPINVGIAKFGLQKKTETILMYSKNKSNIYGFNLDSISNKLNYPHKGKFGACRFEIIEKSDAGGYKRDTMKFKILGLLPREGKRWQIGEETAKTLEANGKVEIVDGIVKRAIYPEDEIDKIQYKPFWSLFLAKDVDTAQDGKNELNELIGNSIGFDTVKPVKLIEKLSKYLGDNYIALDFFSGSATTAHAVMRLNAEDGGNRKFIMVQIPEKCDEKKEAYKAGFKNVCEIGKERIRRAGKKIKNDLVAEIDSIKKEIEKEREKENKEKSEGKDPYRQPKGCHFPQQQSFGGSSSVFKKTLPQEVGGAAERSEAEGVFSKINELTEKLAKKESILTNLDIGFKCFEVADTNIKWIYDEVYKTPQKQTLSYKEDNARSNKDRIDFTPGFTDLDVVYELMLRQYGIPLSTKIEKLSDISDRTYIFADTCVICLDDNITDDIVTKLADIEPVPAVYILRDSAFGDDIALKDYTYRKLTAMIQGNLNKDELNNRFNNFKVEFI